MLQSTRYAMVNAIVMLDEDGVTVVERGGRDRRESTNSRQKQKYKLDSESLKFLANFVCNLVGISSYPMKRIPTSSFISFKLLPS